MGGFIHALLVIAIVVVLIVSFEVDVCRDRSLNSSPQRNKGQSEPFLRRAQHLSCLRHMLGAFLLPGSSSHFTSTAFVPSIRFF